MVGFTLLDRLLDVFSHNSAERQAGIGIGLPLGAVGFSRTLCLAERVLHQAKIPPPTPSLPLEGEEFGNQSVDRRREILKIGVLDKFCLKRRERKTAPSGKPVGVSACRSALWEKIPVRRKRKILTPQNHYFCSSGKTTS